MVYSHMAVNRRCSIKCIWASHDLNNCSVLKNGSTHILQCTKKPRIQASTKWMLKLVGLICQTLRAAYSSRHSLSWACEWPCTKLSTPNYTIVNPKIIILIKIDSFMVPSTHSCDGKIIPGIKAAMMLHLFQLIAKTETLISTDLSWYPVESWVVADIHGVCTSSFVTNYRVDVWNRIQSTLLTLICVKWELWHLHKPQCLINITLSHHSRESKPCQRLLNKIKQSAWASSSRSQRRKMQMVTNCSPLLTTHWKFS